MSALPVGAIRERAAHNWQRESHEHYVEPQWCSTRLFEEVRFEGVVWDPACGFGRIPSAAKLAGYKAIGSDVVDRGYPHDWPNYDFLSDSRLSADNVVSNPPFKFFEAFARAALFSTTRKVALLWLVRRLNAARWLTDTPLAQILLLTPRPSMPPGHIVANLAKLGKEPSGGTQDICWLIWDHDFAGYTSLGWLHRDAPK